MGIKKCDNVYRGYSAQLGIQITKTTNSDMAEVLLICGGRGGGLVVKSCLILVTPWTITCQAPLSMGNYIKCKCKH